MNDDLLPKRHIPQTPSYMLNPTLTPTLLVRKKSSGRLLRIDPERFDPERHEKVEEKKTARVRAASKEAPPPSSSVSEAEMATMSLAAIKELPEFARITVRWRNKQELIQEILKIRDED